MIVVQDQMLKVFTFYKDKESVLPYRVLHTYDWEMFKYSQKVIFLSYCMEIYNVHVTQGQSFVLIFSIFELFEYAQEKENLNNYR